MKRIIVWMGMMVVSGAAAWATPLELFNAQNLAEADWSWSDARVRKQQATWVITEIHKQDTAGNVFVERRFPVHPDGEIAINVQAVPRGALTFQVLAFAGETPIYTAEPLKNVTRPGRHVLNIRDLGLPSQTQSLLFKLWVSEAEGASAVLDELRYYIPLFPDLLVLDETVGASSAWVATDAQWAVSGSGGHLTLAADKSYGSALFDRWLNRADDQWLLLHAPIVKAGTLTLQLVAFDEAGAYLESVDVVAAFGRGWHGIPLSQVAWPEGAAQFKVKLWLGGTPDAEAVVERVLLLKAAPLQP